MSTRTYIRTYLAEVTETFTFTDDDLTAEQVAVLDDFDRGFAESLHADVAEILDDFDVDHEEIARADEGSVTIERTA